MKTQYWTYAATTGEGLQCKINLRLHIGYRFSTFTGEQNATQQMCMVKSVQLLTYLAKNPVMPRRDVQY